MKIKIMFVVESLSCGGAEKALLTLIKNLDKDRYDITVFTIVNTGIYVDEIKKYCKLKYALNDYNYYTSIGRLYYKIKMKLIYNFNISVIYRWLIKDKYDIEIAFVEGFDTKFVSASKNKNSKKYAWIHTDVINNNYSDKYFSNISEQRKCYLQFNKIICVSEDVKAQFIKKFNLSKVITIHNLIDTEHLLKYKKSNYKLMKKLKFCAVGRLETEKGFDRLILSLSGLNKYNYELLIMGKGSQEKKLKKLVEKHNLENKIKFLGFLNNPYIVMAESDLLICPSRSEGFSLVIAEAMVLGIPVLSTRCMGPIELTVNGKYGLLIENSVKSLEKALLDIFEHRDILYKLHQKSLERGNMFCNDTIIEQIYNLFDEKY